MKPPVGLPFPSGWFCVAASADARRGAVMTVTFMGQELVLFRTDSGALGLVDAYCPHLGAHMGHGGRVEGETLRCPFHGFRYARSGACVAAYDGKAPANARVRVRAWPIREKHGLVLAWYHPDSREPDWEVPDLDLEGWSSLLMHRFSLRGHPQETSENSVDLGHFGVIHGYTGLETVVDTKADGPRLTATYRFSRFIGKGRLGVSALVEIHVQVHGLGYSLVDMLLPALGVRTRQLVLPAPTQKDHIDLRIAMMTEDVRRLKLVGPFLPGFLTQLVAHAIFPIYKHDVQQDFEIWKNKRYLQPPLLARGDGPIMLYRKWASQFYPAADKARRALPVAPGDAGA